MAHCLECGIFDGVPGTYFTCRNCEIAGRSPEARRAGRGSPPIPYAPSTEIVLAAVPAREVPVNVELRFSVKKDRRGKAFTYSYPAPRTRFNREDPI